MLEYESNQLREIVDNELDKQKKNFEDKKFLFENEKNISKK